MKQGKVVQVVMGMQSDNIATSMQRIMKEGSAEEEAEK
jgi:phosphotransferase system IIB component